MNTAQQEYSINRKKDDLAQNYYHISKGEALPPPVISLSVNNNCYMRCKMCDIGAANAKRINEIGDAHMSDVYLKDKKYREFPIDRLKALVDEMAPHNSIIRTSFIEPLMYSKLHELVEYVKSKGLRYYTITNGWMLKKHANWAVEAEVNLLRVSIDGTKEIHDEIRGMKGLFDRAMTGLKMALEHKQRLGKKQPILGICYTISDHNYWHIVEFMDMLHKENVLEHIYVNFSHLQFASDWEVKKTIAEYPERFKDLKPCSTVGVNPGQLDTKVLQEQIDLLKKKYPLDKYHYYFDPNIEGQYLKDYYDPSAWMFKNGPCFLPWYITQIDVSGNVTIRGHCIFPSFGNIMEQPFMDVWNSAKAIEFRQWLKKNGTVAACNKCIGSLYSLRGRG